MAYKMVFHAYSAMQVALPALFLRFVL